MSPFAIFLAVFVRTNAEDIFKWKLDDLKAAINSADKAQQVFNFWTTFCKPCVEAASLFINNKTGYCKFFEEQLSREKLQKEIESILKKD